MAISIISSPSKWTPAYNHIQYEVSSTNYLECNFRFIADIYIRGTFITRIKLFPDYTNSNHARFEFNTIIQQYLTFDLNIYEDSFTECPNSYLDYYIKFGEEYDTSTGCNGTITQYPDLTISDTKYAFNGALDEVSFAGYSVNDYKLNGSSKCKFLTNQPDLTSIPLNAHAQLQYIQDVSTSSPALPYADYLVVKTYDINNVLQGIYFLPNTNNTEYDKIYSIGVGPMNIMEAELNGDYSITTGTFPILKSDIEYYEVTLYQLILPSTFNQKTYAKKYRIDRTKQTDHRRFYFLGALGNMDSFSFIHTENSSINISKNEFTKLNNSENYQLRGRTIIQSDAKDKFTSVSGLLTTKEANFLAELYSSIEVYLLVENDLYCFYNSIDVSGYTYYTMDANYDLDQINTGDKFIVYNDTELYEITVNDIDGNQLSASTGDEISVTCGKMLLNNKDAKDLIPIIVTDSNFSYITKLMKKYNRLTINYEKSYNKNIQRN